MKRHSTVRFLLSEQFFEYVGLFCIAITKEMGAGKRKGMLLRLELRLGKAKTGLFCLN